MIVRLAIRYLCRSLPKGYYLTQITEILGFHLGSLKQKVIIMQTLLGKISMDSSGNIAQTQRAGFINQCDRVGL